LVKKVVLADGIAVFVGPAFQAVGAGHAPSLAEAWGAALAYTFQLYFDFSGYCDMAIGASWLFGIGLPLNFNSPYKATNIIDFWRRWHITLSRFLRDYLYIPLGGNRRGSVRRYANLLATMVIGGLWHGAGWTFVIWGALHGLYLIVNHAWIAVRPRVGLPDLGRAGTILGWAITFLAVVVGWVFFRATSLRDALRMVVGMSGANGLGLDSSATSIIEVYQTWAWCVGLGAIAFLLPNTEEFMGPYLPAIARPPGQRSPMGLAALTFAPSLGWVAVTAILLAAGLISLPQPTNFLYFNF
jgi:D-alanyl-lipoteichoic acid acyltransferase DltB (MBOAT superfamily)